MKLTKQQARQHSEAVRLVALDRDLTEDEKEFILDHWQEAATARNALDGAFFTPAGLGVDLSIEVTGDRIIDLCAGIGRLAWSCRDWMRRANNEAARELVCVEKNPAYVAVGRKVLAEARWVCTDLFDLPDDLGRYDTAIANPPFGHVARTGNGPRYTGRRFEYHAIAVAATLARRGVFILPQGSTPFRYRGHPYFAEERSAEYDRFEGQTGIRLESGCGIDTSVYVDEWRGVAPRTEVATVDFKESTPVPPPATASGTEPMTQSALFGD